MRPRGLERTTQGACAPGAAMPQVSGTTIATPFGSAESAHSTTFDTPELIADPDGTTTRGFLTRPAAVRVGTDTEDAMRAFFAQTTKQGDRYGSSVIRLT